MVKWKGQVTNMAPFVSGLAVALGSSASPLALATVFAVGGVFGAGGARAVTSTPGPASVCAGAAGADVTQTITGAPVSVTATAGFGVSTATGDAIKISGKGGTSVNVGNAIITAPRIGLYVRELGAGPVTVTSTGSVSVTGPVYCAIRVEGQSLSTDLTMNAASASSAVRDARCAMRWKSVIVGLGQQPSRRPAPLLAGETEFMRQILVGP